MANPLSNPGLNLALALLLILTLPQELFSIPACSYGITDSPIDINKPTYFTDFELLFTYRVLTKYRIEKHEDRHVKFSANFGEFTYQNIKYQMQSIDIFSPAEHEIGGVRYPMELQIKAYEPGEGGSIMTLVIVFDV
jgi:carbonic anhydrase